MNPIGRFVVLITPEGDRYSGILKKDTSGSYVKISDRKKIYVRSGDNLTINGKEFSIE